MHAKSGTRKRTTIVLSAVVGLIVGLLVSVASTAVVNDGVADAARPNLGVQENPDLAASCGTDVIVVLDESGSINTAGAVGDVETAVQALVQGLNNTGSRMRFSEFSTNARDANIGGTTAFQEVTDDFVTDVNTYLTTGGNAELPTNYNPGTGEQFTNWEAGLFEAAVARLAADADRSRHRIGRSAVGGVHHRRQPELHRDGRRRPDP